MHRCHSVCETYWPLFLSLYEDFVASESVVKLRLLLVRTSALLPRKPMRLTLFWYMIVSPFVEFPDLDRGTIKRVGHAPKCRSSAFTEAPEKSFRRSFRKRFGGTKQPAGAAQPKQKSELPQGA